MLLYDKYSQFSIEAYAKTLIGKSLSEYLGIGFDSEAFSGKGRLGQYIEKHFFQYEVNSSPLPDFVEAGLELKTSPLKQLKNGSYRAKERIPLGIINYDTVVTEELLTSSLIRKSSDILLMFYLWKQDQHFLEYSFRIVGIWSIPQEDMIVIQSDWEKISKKIRAGKAHELSEGDTFYLGAATKGANKSSTRPQPFSDEPAMQRAFSFKQGYVNHIIAKMSGSLEGQYGKLIHNDEGQSKTIEEVVFEKFKPYIGKTIEEFADVFNYTKFNSKTKSAYSTMAKAIVNLTLGVPKGLKAEEYFVEFRKSDLNIKTVRLDSDALPCESISLPPFNYEEIASGTWEDSNLKSYVERRYLFVFLKYDLGDTLRFDSIKFWNMSNQDISEAERIWVDLQDLILNGNIVKELKVNKSGKEYRRTNFPSIKTKKVHIRPHGANSLDTYPLPIRDQVTGEMEYTKHSFWFNPDYIRDEVYLKN